MPVDTLVSALVALLVVVDPIGLAPIFLALTEGMTNAARRRVAVRAGLIALCVLAGFALAGRWLLAQLGITLPAFRIAGGLLLFAIAFEMVYGRRSDRQSRTAEQAAHEDHAKHIAAFPLAIPLLAGPGAITATLLLTGQTGGNPALLAALLVVIAIVIGIALIVFCLAVPIARVIGTTGNLVLSRLLGIILAALAVQFVIDGLRAALAG
jgi:multiple antibiotic resistance protein